MNAPLRLVNAFCFGILAFSLSLFMIALVTPAPAATSLPPTAPAFTLADAAGQPHALADFQKRPVALFFFCGCPWCHQCAQVWGQFQRGGALAPSAGAPAPQTVVVFSGDAPEARAFAAQTGLDMTQTTLLLDPMLRVTQDIYHADPCPRVFVLDAGQTVRYTNTHADDAARTAPALAIASRALTALRAADAKPASASITPATAMLARAALNALDAGGKPVDIAATPGWRVIYFWSATCPCVRACERYSLVPLAGKYKGRVSFFAVASDGWDLNQPKKTLLAQIAVHHLPYPVLLDTTHSIAKSLHAEVTPQTFVLDPAGRVVFQGMPDDSRRFLFSPGPHGCRVQHTYLSVALAEALTGQPVTNSPLKEAGCVIAW